MTATVRRYVPPEEKEKALANGRLPEESDMKELREANDVLHRGLGYSPEDLERKRREGMANLSPQIAFTKEDAAEQLAAIMNAAREAGIADELIEAGTLPDDGKTEES